VNYTRNSLFVKFGRIFQDGYKYLSFLDYFVTVPLLLKKKNSVPLVCIVAPPRSGSTLTYQSLIGQINNFHLTNIWNLLYATPAIGALVSRFTCRNYKSAFQSHNGFVPGVCGESEGMKFWTHWSGQSLVQSEGALDVEKLSKLYSALQKVGQNKVFISGYLGHAFSMNALRRVFPDIIFIHVTRDLLSNAYSIYQRSGSGWFSLKPETLQGKTFHSTHEQVVEQLFAIHAAILQSSKSSDTMQIKYEEICEDPQAAIDKIIGFSAQQSVELEKSADTIQCFQTKKVTSSTNSDTRCLQQFIDKKILERSQNSGFFQSIS